VPASRFQPSLRLQRRAPGRACRGGGPCAAAGRPPPEDRPACGEARAGERREEEKRLQPAAEQVGAWQRRQGTDQVTQ